MSSEESLQEIVCCMGQPVAGNPTQFMMERAFAAAGLDWRFLTLEVSPEDLGDAVRGMRAMGFRGGYFTIPHRVAVIDHLEALTDSAALIGAANCVYRLDSRLIGENTDGKGFVQELSEVMLPKEKKVVILGAGGTARAIAVELGLAGAVGITVVNRSADRGQELVHLLNEQVKVPSRFVHWQGDYHVEEGTDIVVNATSIGLGSDDARVPLNIQSLSPRTVVADVIVNPAETRLLHEAARRGCRTLHGPGMLANEGATIFKIWTGIEPNIGVMREALEEYLEL